MLQKCFRNASEILESEEMIPDATCVAISLVGLNLQPHN